MEYLIYLIPALLGLFVRYDMNKTQATKFIASRISVEDVQGVQNSITNPKDSTTTLILWGLTVIVIISFFYFNGLVAGIICIVNFIICAVLMGAFGPKPESARFIKFTYNRLNNRKDEYNKQGDSARAGAVEIMLNKMKTEFSDIIK